MKKTIIILLLCALEATALSDSVAVIVDRKGNETRYGLSLCAAGEPVCVGNHTASSLAASWAAAKAKETRTALLKGAVLAGGALLALLAWLILRRDEKWMNA